MEENKSTSLDYRLTVLETKIDAIARYLNINLKVEDAAKPPLSTQNETVSPSQLSTKSEYSGLKNIDAKTAPSAGQILGYAGIACLFLAIILLIRLSIDSGWLTPERQLALSTAFGILLIALPFVVKFQFRSYISQLPALGIVIFHLTVYGGVFYHKLIEADAAILLISTIGILSLALLEKFEYEGYVLISIVGTYLGALLLKSGFPSHLAFFGFMVVWDAIYCAYAVISKERKIILITSYLAIGLVSLKVLNMPQAEVEYLKVAFAQIFQFIIFLGGITAYSVTNRVPLKKDEAWSYFPLLIFFYGLEYHLLDKVNSHHATVFSLLFAGVIYGAYHFAKKKSRERLESADMTFTTVACIFAHSYYFVLFSEQLKALTPVLLMGLAYVFRKNLAQDNRFRGVGIVACLVFMYSFGLIFIGSAELSAEFLATIGIFYGSCIVWAAKPASELFSNREANAKTLQMMALVFAHSQILLAIYRMKTILIDRSIVAPLWIFYAFILLFGALKLKDKTLAQSSFPVIALGLLRFMLVDFSRLGGGSRILALLVMGGLIFAGGYLYKKTADSK